METIKPKLLKENVKKYWDLFLHQLKSVISPFLSHRIRIDTVSNDLRDFDLEIFVLTRLA
jgi:hypothetical protein